MPGATVAFADGQIIERSADGDAAVWGTVSRWEPPDAVAFSWHPGQPAERASHVEVTFAALDGQTRVALVHRPGPAAPATGTLFEDPMFAEHVAFLNRMHEAGYLVAAGPLPDTAGEGMTILRLPGTGQLSTATRLATEDDVSASAGFLAVTVRPWQVVMHAGR
jgi:uncharacterized protein YciI